MKAHVANRVRFKNPAPGGAAYYLDLRKQNIINKTRIKDQFVMSSWNHSDGSKLIFKLIQQEGKST
jgi:hypothetical protein